LKSDLQQIKKEIFQKELVQKLLESMGCEEVKPSSNGERLDGARPTGTNSKGFSVYLDEHLVAKVWTQEHLPQVDIFGLVSIFKHNKETSDTIHKDLSNAKRYIINTLKLKGYENGKAKEVTDYNFFLRDIQKKRRKRVKSTPNPTLHDSVMEEFCISPFQGWIDEGINWNTQDKFQVGMDIPTERVIFPVKNLYGEIVGIRGRATRKEDEDKAKYLPIYSFERNKELFNLHNAVPYIKEQNTVVFFEAEKSTMLAYQYGHGNTVSQMGTAISETQVKLIRRIAPEAKIILGFDKDKGTSKVKEIAKVFSHFDNVYSIYDVDDYLELTDKKADAPVDKGKEVYEFLLKEHCYKIPHKYYK